jgi:hypothetical protein
LNHWKLRIRESALAVILKVPQTAAVTARQNDENRPSPEAARRSVVPPDELLPTARALAKEIAAKTAPVSVALIRQMMWRMLGADDPIEAHKVDSRGIYARGRSDDVREGVVSFLEKRPAVFKNKVSADMPDYFPWWNEREYE